MAEARREVTTDRDPREIYLRIIEASGQCQHLKTTDDAVAISLELSGGLALIAVEIRRLTEAVERTSSPLKPSLPQA